METKKKPEMPFDKDVSGIPAGISSCCSSFMAEMEKFEACRGIAGIMSKARWGCCTSPDQKEGDSEAKEESEES